MIGESDLQALSIEALSVFAQRAPTGGGEPFAGSAVLLAFAGVEVGLDGWDRLEVGGGDGLWVSGVDDGGVDDDGGGGGGEEDEGGEDGEFHGWIWGRGGFGGVVKIMGLVWNGFVSFWKRREEIDEDMGWRRRTLELVINSMEEAERYVYTDIFFTE